MLVRLFLKDSKVEHKHSCYRPQNGNAFRLLQVWKDSCRNIQRVPIEYAVFLAYLLFTCLSFLFRKHEVWSKSWRKREKKKEQGGWKDKVESEQAGEFPRLCFY